MNRLIYRLDLSRDLMWSHNVHYEVIWEPYRRCVFRVIS